MDACIDEETCDAWQAAIKAVPVVRGVRKVKVERKDGTIDERDAADVVAALVERQGLEAAVREGALPIEIQSRRAAGLPDLCATCGKALSMSLDAVRKRRPDPKSWACKGCVMRKISAARTPEQRSASTRTQMSDIERRELARRTLATNLAAMTSDQRSERTRKANAARTPEQRVNAGRQGALVRWGSHNEELKHAR